MENRDRSTPTTPTGRTGGEEAQREEFLEALEEVEASTPLIEPSEDEKRNGWDAESLTAYMQEQQASQSLRADPHSAMRRQAKRPKVQNSKYRPLRWRG